jgi:peroxiredoxin
MQLAATNHVPHATFKTRVRDESVGGDNPFRWQDVASEEIFDGRRVIVFALPGAFTPTCSSTHLPRFEELYEDFSARGIDDIYCLSVNDAFVMFQWSKHIGADKVKMLPDGNGEFTRKMGMLVNKENLGFGPRSWRYAMVVNDGDIERMFVEPGLEDECSTDPFEVSDADTVLAWLKGVAAPQAKPQRAAFVG